MFIHYLLNFLWALQLYKVLKLILREEVLFCISSDDSAGFSVLQLFDLKKKKGGGRGVRQSEKAVLSIFLVVPQSVWKCSLSIPCRQDIKPTHLRGASGWYSICLLISVWWGSSVVSFSIQRWGSPPRAPSFGWRTSFSCLFQKMWVLLRNLNKTPDK